MLMFPLWGMPLAIIPTMVPTMMSTIPAPTRQEVSAAIAPVSECVSPYQKTIDIRIEMTAPTTKDAIQSRLRSFANCAANFGVIHCADYLMLKRIRTPPVLPETRRELSQPPETASPQHMAVLWLFLVDGLIRSVVSARELADFECSGSFTDDLRMALAPKFRKKG